MPLAPMPNIGTRTPNASALSWPLSKPTTPIVAPAMATTICAPKQAHMVRRMGRGAVEPVSRNRLATPTSSVRDRSRAAA